MSLVDNVAGVSFFGGYNIDKVVNVLEGSYNLADTDIRSGDLATLDEYTVPHGFTRPVFTEIFWSLDGDSYRPGASYLDFGAIAVSDSSNVYILTYDSFNMFPTGTIDYKIICTWITDYDNTNPLVDSFQYPDNPIAFDGRTNYQKIYKEGSFTYPPGTLGSNYSSQIEHALGYRPNAKAWIESIAGEVWPMNTGGVANRFLYDSSQDEMSMIIQDDYVELDVLRFSNQSRKVWYKIYYDTN